MEEKTFKLMGSTGAINIAFGIPMIESPIDNSTNVIDMINA